MYQHRPKQGTLTMWMLTAKDRQKDRQVLVLASSEVTWAKASLSGVALNVMATVHICNNFPLQKASGFITFPQKSPFLQFFTIFSQACLHRCYFKASPFPSSWVWLLYCIAAREFFPLSLHPSGDRSEQSSVISSTLQEGTVCVLQSLIHLSYPVAFLSVT